MAHIEDYPDEVWDDLLAVMLTAPFLLTKAVLPGMRSKGNYLRVIACNSGTQMRVRDSSATRIFFKKIRMMQHQAQKITPTF